MVQVPVAGVEGVSGSGHDDVTRCRAASRSSVAAAAAVAATAAATTETTNIRLIYSSEHQDKQKCKSAVDNISCS